MHERLLRHPLQGGIDGGLDDQIAVMLADQLGKKLGHPVDRIGIAGIVAFGRQLERLHARHPGLFFRQVAGLRLPLLCDQVHQFPGKVGFRSLGFLNSLVVVRDPEGGLRINTDGLVRRLDASQLGLVALM